jgi:D-glycero-alpha-D-manno-heptose-7-phosphate kinase
MFYTGDQRSASAILEEQKNSIKSDDKISALKRMVAMVEEAKQSLKSSHLDDFGKILHENWMLKKSLASGITNNIINEAYDAAIEAGAIGGKLLGAGGGGFLLFYVPQNHHTRVSDTLKSLRKFDFKFEEEGSKLIHYSDE